MPLNVLVFDNIAHIFSFQIPRLQVREKWYENVVNADTINIHNEILDAVPGGNKVITLNKNFRHSKESGFYIFYTGIYTSMDLWYL